MRETGTFQKAVEWIDGAIIRIQNIASGLKSAFTDAWNAVTDIRSLLDPVGVFSRIYQAFRRPIVELISFAVEVATMILKFIKDALLRRLSAWARNTWGYPLLTVLLGKDPFTDEIVPRTPKNIIRGFMALLPGGEEKFNRLEETGAIDRMVTWISGAVSALNITREYITGLFTGLWQSFSIRDLTDPFGVFRRVIDTFAEPVARIMAFIWEVIKALVMFGLEVMNFPFDTISSIVNNAMQAFEDIKRDPIGFFHEPSCRRKTGFCPIL
jgi:phage-related protein